MWWIIASLIIAGLILFFVETLLTPGIGVAGILSLASFTGACWYSFTYAGHTTGIWVTAGTVVTVVLLVLVLVRSRTWKRMALDTDITASVDTGISGIKAGDRGVALTRLAPIGTGKFAEISVEVKSFDSCMVDAGTEIEVVELDDNKAIVKPINTK